MNELNEDKLTVNDLRTLRRMLSRFIAWEEFPSEEWYELVEARNIVDRQISRRTVEKMLGGD